MGEKVLGFYEKDAIKDKHTKINPFGLWHFKPKDKVPVVSVEEIEDKIIKLWNDRLDLLDDIDVGDDDYLTALAEIKESLLPKQKSEAGKK